MPTTCRWLLNTQVLFLKKSRDLPSKEFDDNEWLDSLLSGAESCVGESEVVAVGDEMDVDETRVEEPHERKTEVRLIQMGEFLRKWVSKRLLRLHGGDIGKVMTDLRQFGCGMPGGTETMSIFHQLIFDLWKDGAITRPLARVKIDEKNCFGMLEWRAIRTAVKKTLPQHHAVACFKHAATSFVEQLDIDAVGKDRGAEQGDVDGPLECSLTLGQVASAARMPIHNRQRNGELPWASACISGSVEEEAANKDYDERITKAAAWDAATPTAKRQPDGRRSLITDPRHEIQKSGGIADFWYLDDGDVLCDPLLVPAYLRAFDDANKLVGAMRNAKKTEVVYYATRDEMERNSSIWRLEEVRGMASLLTPEDANLTLGVAIGGPQAVGQSRSNSNRK